MDQRSTTGGHLFASYLEHRRAIGILGLSLPFLVGIGALLTGEGPQSSISGYYYTHMGTVLVGTFWAIGFFLLGYKGHDGADDRAGNAGFIFAIGMSLFPTDRDGVGPTAPGIIHLVFAGAFFLTLAGFSLFLFPLSNKPLDPPKKLRNRAYLTCGAVMVLCLGLMLWYIVVLGGDRPSSPLAPLRPVYWLETIAIVAFGFSWLVKGRFLVLDDPGGEGA